MLGTSSHHDVVTPLIIRVATTGVVMIAGRRR